MSLSVVDDPIENLIEPLIHSLLMPMASRTWEASILPDEQALPADANIPFKSRFTTIDSSSRPLKLTLNVLKSLFVGWPFSFISFIFLFKPSYNLSRNISIFLFWLRFFFANKTALPKPTIAGMFSVPARKPLS